jgi:hypothetical protein
MKPLLVAFVATLVPALTLAQSNPAAQAARTWRQQRERAIVDEFVGLLSIPNIARDRDNIQRNAEAIAARTLAIPIGNHDNNQHSRDENLRIQNLWDGIELMAALLTM